MESLVFTPVLILGSIFGLGLVAVVLSWFRSGVAKALTYVFATASIAAGAWVGWVLIEGNGLAIAAVAVLMGLFGFWNSRRRNKS